MDSANSVLHARRASFFRRAGILPHGHSKKASVMRARPAMIRHACAAMVCGILALSATRANEPANAESEPDINALVEQLTKGDAGELRAAFEQASAHLSKHPDALLPAMIECARKL